MRFYHSQVLYHKTSNFARGKMGILKNIFMLVYPLARKGRGSVDFQDCKDLVIDGVYVDGKEIPVSFKRYDGKSTT